MTITGRVPLLLLAGAFPVVLRPTFGTAWSWIGLVVLLILLDWWAAPRTENLELTRSPNPRVRLEEPACSTLTASNSGRRRLHGVLRDAWQPTAGATGNRHRITLASGGRARFTTDLLPVRRGDLAAVGVTIRLFGPLGLAARQRTRSVPGAVRALPPFGSRKHLPSRLARLRELDGRAAVRVRAPGTQFDSLREYVRGDDVRSIDWRASARNRSVVVRTWQPERDRRIVLVLDTSRTSAGRVADVPRLDSAMDAALLLAALASRAGDRVDFIAGDRAVRTRLRVSGTEVVGRLQDAMSGLAPIIAEADWSVLAGAIAQLGRQRSLVVLLTPLEPYAVEEGLLPVLPTLARHHRVVVASVRDPALEEMVAARADVEQVYGAAAASKVVQRRRRTAEVLGSLGVEVIDVDADNLAPALADHYLKLKAAGKL
jgi:uncharacterized protein (DUF58 family)